MYLTPHASVGILISQHVDKPLWVFVFAFLSHFVLDFIPHGDEPIGEWMHSRLRRVVFIATIDLTLVFFMTMTVLAIETDPTTTSLYLAGIFGAILPDFLSMVFPKMHEKLNWFFVVRWVHSILHTSRITHMVSGVNWLHMKLHKFLLNRYQVKISLERGIIFQSIFLVFVLLLISYSI
ncbi:MAG: hypothetical protein WCV86_00610 [Patescibacteria group bacterium]|jgi:hypothetical protein